MNNAVQLDSDNADGEAAVEAANLIATEVRKGPFILAALKFDRYLEFSRPAPPAGYRRLDIGVLAEPRPPVTK